MLYRRILITGANGLLGQHLVRLMSGMAGYDVLATGRTETPAFTGGSCGYMKLDICDSDAVSAVFTDFSPDVVINCAAMTQVDECETAREECWKVNAVAVETLAKYCLASGTRLIQISTDFIFDGVNGPYKESARPNPLSYYGRSKLAGENYARGAGMNRWAIVRTVLVYGVAENMKRSNFVGWLKDSLEEGKAVKIVTDHWRTPTYVQDLALGIEKIVRFSKYGVYNISGRDYLTVYDFAVEVARTLSLDLSLITPTESSSFKSAAARPSKSGFIILKAESELGYSPHSIRSAVLEMEKESQRLNSSP